MARISIDVEVDEKSLQRTMKALEQKLERGAKKGLDDTLDVAKTTAKQKIEANRTPFTSPHLSSESSFQTIIESHGDDHIYGIIRNDRDYAAFVDKGVSGTQNSRDTPFSYTNSKPPLSKLIPWVEERLGDWDIETDPDIDFGSDDEDIEDTDEGTDYYRTLNDYDVDDSFKKQRIESSDDVAEGMDVVFDNGDNTFEATVINVSEDEDKIRLRYNVDFERNIDFSDDDERAQVIARQKKTVARELEQGQEVIFETGVNKKYDRDAYGEVVGYEYNEKGKITGIKVDDSFKRFDSLVTYSPRQFKGTREDLSDEWASEVDFSESVGKIPEGYSETSALDEEILNLIWSTDNATVIINDGGDRYIASSEDYVNVNYTFDAGRDIDGNILQWSFDDLEELQNANYSIEAVETKFKSWKNLSEGDEIIVDVADVPDSDSKWGIKSFHANTKIRAKVETIRKNDDGSYDGIWFVTSQASSIGGQLRFDDFVGTRKNNSGSWNAKNTQPGDIVTYQVDGKVYTGKYITDSTASDDRDKSYKLGRIHVYTPEDRLRNINDEDVISVEKNSDFRGTIEDTPINFDLPDGFYEYNYTISDDYKDDVTYYAWDYRNQEFLEVEHSNGVKSFTPKGDSDRPLRHEEIKPELFTHPINIVGSDDDSISDLDYSQAPSSIDDLPQIDDDDVSLTGIYDGMDIVVYREVFDEWIDGEVIKHNYKDFTVRDKNTGQEIVQRYTDTDKDDIYFTHGDAFSTKDEDEKKDIVFEELRKTDFTASSYTENEVFSTIEGDLLEKTKRPDLVKNAVSGLEEINEDVDKNANIGGQAVTKLENSAISLKENNLTTPKTMSHEFIHVFHGNNQYRVIKYPHDKRPDWKAKSDATSGNTKYDDLTSYFLKPYKLVSGYSKPDTSEDYLGKGNIIDQVNKEVGIYDLDFKRSDKQTPSIIDDVNNEFDSDSISEGEVLVLEYNGEKTVVQVKGLGIDNHSLKVYNWKTKNSSHILAEKENVGDGTNLIAPSRWFDSHTNDNELEVQANYIDNFGTQPTHWDWTPNSDKDIEKLFEAANKAWFKQIRQEYKNNNSGQNWKDGILYSDYSKRSPTEVVTRVSEYMFARESENSHRTPHVAGIIEERYPELVDAWTNLFEPSEDVKDHLNNY